MQWLSTEPVLTKSITKTPRNVCCTFLRFLVTSLSAGRVARLGKTSYKRKASRNTSAGITVLLDSECIFIINWKCFCTLKMSDFVKVYYGILPTN